MEVLFAAAPQLQWPGDIVPCDRDLWAGKMEWEVNHNCYLAEHDLDSLQVFSSDVVLRVQQKMEKEKCCFCLAKEQYDN